MLNSYFSTYTRLRVHLACTQNKPAYAVSHCPVLLELKPQECGKLARRLSFHSDPPTKTPWRVSACAFTQPCLKIKKETNYSALRNWNFIKRHFSFISIK